MPFAGYKNFADCMSKVKGKSKLSKQKICGKLQSLHEKKHEIEEIRKQFENHRNEVKIIERKLAEIRRGRN